MKTQLKRSIGNGLLLVILLAAPLGLCLDWRTASAQQNVPSPGTISTNPEAAQAERDWDNALANALAAAHQLSDAQQNGSGPATLKDMQNKYEQAVKAANDAWDRFQSCLPQSQRCLLNSDLTLQTPGSATATSPTNSPAEHAPSNISNSSNKTPQPPSSQSTDRSSSDQTEICGCDYLRFQAQLADMGVQSMAFYDNNYARQHGYHDPGLEAQAAEARDGARAAWAKYNACLKEPPCPPRPSRALPDRNDPWGLFAYFFGVPVEYDPPHPSDPPPANLFDAPLPTQDLNPEDGNHREVPGHFARDEFGNLTFQCDEDGCSATESPLLLQLTPNSATESAKPPVVQPPSSVAPRTEEMIRADVQYHIMGNWRTHGCIKFNVHPIGLRSFGTVPLVYERDVQTNDSIFKYGIILPAGQTYGFTLPQAAPPNPRALAVAALNALDWSMSRRLSLAGGYTASGARGGISVPGELVLTALIGSSATNVAEHGEVVGPSQAVVVGEARVGTSASPANPSAGNFVLADFRVDREFGSPRLPLAGTSSGTIYSIVSNGKSSGQALELQAYDPAGKVKRVVVPVGTVLEPVTQPSAKPVASRLPRNAALVKEPLTAYCLEFSKLPPEEGMYFRIAPQPVQEKFQFIRSVLRAAHKLGVDDDTTQYSVWTAIGKWDAEQFADRFVEHSKKNAEAMNVKWTPQFESAVRGIVPERWRIVSMVLQEAARP